MPRSNLFVEHASFVSLVDAGFWTARHHGAALLPSALVYGGVAPLLVEWGLPSEGPDGPGFAALTGALAISVFGMLGSYAVAWGLWQAARGREPSAAQVLAAPWREAEQAIPLAFLFSALVTLGFVVLVVPGLLVLVFMLVAAPVAAVEKSGPVDTLRRAWELGSGQRWWAAGVLGVIVLGTSAANLPLALFDEPALPASVLVAVLEAAVGLLGDSLTFLLYADLRVRKESFDLELLAQEVAPESEDPPGASGSTR